MDKASQTVSGLFSTLQDDSSALLGKVFTPVSDGLKNILLPAAIGTVGIISGAVDGVADVVTGLFNKRNLEITATADIENAIDNLNTLDTDLKALHTKYLTDVITVNINAEDAKNKLDELKQLKLTDKEMLTESEAQRMVELTNSLVALIPALGQYVGSNGILNTEKDAVDGLVESYKELSIVKVAAQYAADVEARYNQALVDQAMLEKTAEDLTKEQKSAQELADKWGAVEKNSDTAYTNIIEAPEIDTGALQTGLDVLQKYVDMGGSLEALTSMDIDLSSQFGENGKALDAEAIQSDADAVNNLLEALEVVSLESNQSQNAENNKVSAIGEAIATASQAITEHLPTVEAAALELQRINEIVDSMRDGSYFNGTDQAATDAGKNTKKAFVGGMEAEADADAEGPLTRMVNADGAKAESAVKEKAEKVKAALKASMGIGGDMQAATDGAVGGAEDGGDEAGAITALGTRMMEQLAAAISQNTAPKTAVQQNLSVALGAASPYVGRFNGLGLQIANGVAAGVRSGAGAVAAAVVQMINDALAAGKSAAQIHSPSGLFRDALGVFLPMGAAAGVDAKAHVLGESVERMVNGSLDAAGNISQRIASGVVSGGGLTGTAAAAQPKVIVVEKTVEQTNNFNQPVQTPDEFANTMRLYARYGLAGED